MILAFDEFGTLDLLHGIIDWNSNVNRDVIVNKLVKRRKKIKKLVLGYSQGFRWDSI